MKKEILNHFKNNDPILYPYVNKYKKDLMLEIQDSKDYFLRLSRSIAFQQLHGKAAEKIWNRFLDLFQKPVIKPVDVINIENEKLRLCGLSNAKANYIKNIAYAFNEDENYNNLGHLSNEEIIELLTKIKGVGQWTAEMFLIFTLGREDIFSFGDYGLKKGLIKIYKMKKDPSKDRINKIIKKWSPYKTYASLALWKVADEI